MDVRESYDSAATAYTEHLASELVNKPLDRHSIGNSSRAFLTSSRRPRRW